MLSKNKIKYLCSLHRKKIREKDSVFIAEGEKLVSDLLQAGLKASLIVCVEEKLAGFDCFEVAEIIPASSTDIKKISLLKTTPDVFAVFYQPEHLVDEQRLPAELSLCLDGIQDPGNLGTIIRTADWFGINTILCINGCADCYNPKTVQATMGAIARVKVMYVDLGKIEEIYKSSSVYGCYMDGENLYKSELSKNGLIIMGSEGQGISAETAKIINRKISIPSYAQGQTSESLNVAVAASITISEFKRRF